MNYIKMSPIAGMSGYGGGATALPFSGAASVASTGKWQGTRGILFNGYYSGSNKDVIQYFTIASLGNTADFGDTVIDTRGRGSASDGTIGFVAGGFSDHWDDDIGYITIGTTGNATDFGNLTSAGNRTAVCDGAYGIMGGKSESNIIDYIVVATPGDATDFGDFLGTGMGSAGSTNDATRAIWFGGHQGDDVMDYITMASAGNAADFGDMFDTGYAQASGVTANSTRGLVAGGVNSMETIQYVVVQTLSNGIDFGFNMYWMKF